MPAKFALAIAAIVLVIFGGLPYLSFWQQLEVKGFDILSVASAPMKSGRPISIVSIDEQSFQHIKKQWPWPRAMHAHLLDQITKLGAAVVVFDIMMPEPSMMGEKDDEAFADAISRGNVVLASNREYEESGSSRQWIRIDPLPLFLSSGATKGYAAVELDSDLVLRQLPQGDDVMWRVVLRRLNEKFPGMVSFVEPERNAMIRYVGRDRTFPYLKYYQMLDADKVLPPGALKDHIVLVGRDLTASTDQSAAQADLFATPFTSSTKWLTPGVEIHANILETIVRGNSIAPAAASSNFLLLLAVVAIAILAMRRWRPLLSALAGAAVIVAVGGLDWVLFTQYNTWLPVFAAMSSVIAIYFAYGGVAFVGEQRRRNEIRRAFSLYVSPEVVDHVLQHPDRLALGGERREVTMFFTDLEGFTPLTERLGPEQVTRILNMHFSRVTAIIKRHGGTVNRFIGDAVMAMWGAPLDDAKQAENACRAAVEVQEDMVDLRKELTLMGLPEIRMRIGIHTCVAVIGNLGSSDRFDYTAIGDGVNLAARLEGVNKLYGTGILIGGDTVAKVAGAVPMRLVDRVIVKGKSEPVDIYTPSKDLALNELGEQAIAAYRDRRWEESEALWQGVLKHRSDDRVAAVYLERIVRLKMKAPDANWKGAVELEKL